jgi:CheY-like chemotaxis protein
MKILVTDPSAVDLLLVAGCLRDLGHEVRTASNRKEAIVQLTQGLPQVVIVDASEPDRAGLDLIRLLRGLETPSYVYIMMLAGEVSDERVLRAYEAGIDVHMRKPAVRDQLAARLRAADRVLALDHTPRRPIEASKLAQLEVKAAAAAPAVAASVVPPTPAPPAPNGRTPANGQSRTSTAEFRASALSKLAMSAPPAVDALAATVAWTGAPAALQTVAGEFFPIAIGLGEAPARGERPVTTCITLSNVQQQLEMRVLIQASVDDARALAQHLFGEDNIELATDMLAELANLLMGSLKGSFARDGFAFTGGLPKPAVLHKFERWLGRCEHRQAFALTTEGAELAVQIGLRAKLNIVVPVSRLREDMVIATDIVHANGVLLLPGGTRLSATTAERVRRMLPNGSVALMDPDDVLDYLTERQSG